MNHEATVRRIQKYHRNIEKIRRSREKKRLIHFLKGSDFFFEEREKMAVKIVRRYDREGNEITEEELKTFRLDSPVVREILANLNREIEEGVRRKEQKDDD